MKHVVHETFCDTVLLKSERWHVRKVKDGTSVIMFLTIYDMFVTPWHVILFMLGMVVL